MPKEKPPDPPEPDVPSWVMTFSDVITLLMTFFILLLTFASDQKESFERMQVAVFGGGGGTGIAGENPDMMDRDSVLMRERPRSGRITRRGSEMPTTYTDPTYESMAKGIAGLEEEEDRVLSSTHSITFPLPMIIASDGSVTSFGAHHLRTVAAQMRKMPLRLDLFVHDVEGTSAALSLADRIYANDGVPFGRTGVGN